MTPGENFAAARIGQTALAGCVEVSRHDNGSSARRKRDRHSSFVFDGGGPLKSGTASNEEFLTGREEIQEGETVNEQLMASSYVGYCENLLALRKSGDWKDWHETWDGYVQERWGLSKSRAKLLCDFARLRQLCEAELMGTLPETPEQVKALLALPQKHWLETWELVLQDNRHPIRPANVESTMQRFHIYAHKTLSPEAKKAIRVRRAAKTMAEMQDGVKLVNEIGGRALGKNWNKAVEVVIDADQERMNEASGGR